LNAPPTLVAHALNYINWFLVECIYPLTTQSVEEDHAHMWLICCCCRPSGLTHDQFNALSFRCGRVLLEEGQVRIQFHHWPPAHSRPHFDTVESSRMSLTRSESAEIFNLCASKLEKDA